MEENFPRLQRLSTQLNQSSDALNEVIKDIETKLASLRLGIAVWVDVEPAKAPYDYGVQLGYAKHGAMWRLLRWEFTLSENGSKSDNVVCPMLEIPREHRLTAVQHLPELIAQILESAKVEAEAVDKARHTAESALALLR